MDLRRNYEEVLDNIQKACNDSGRDRNEVTLIAVSKTKPIEMLEAFNEMGQVVFGENHVQEIVEKHELHPEYQFHMIGHLQRNKVRQVVDKVAMIHSVDSVRLAEEISKESVKRGLTTEILLEINAAEEESKYGLRPDETEEAVRTISKLPGIIIKGLMTVAPFVEDPEENRPVFRLMKKLAVDIAEKKIDNVDICHLSMGMTNDYVIAIEEGATLVRVGTALFGERNYNR